MPDISIKTDKLQLYTPVPNWFIDNYMADTNSTFVVVYLFYLRYISSREDIPPTNQAADMLGILESDILKSFNHWEKEGILKQEKDSNSIYIHFLDEDQNNKDSPVQEVKTELELESEKKYVDLNSMPQYSVHELEIYKTSSSDIDRLFKLAERKLGTLLKYTDLNILFGLYDWLKLPLDVIEILIAYCAELDKRNMNYIQSVAIDWAEKNINTAEKAREHIKTFSTDYREILKALGLGKNNPAPVQVEFMEKWLKEYKMPLDVILEACDVTIMQTGKAEFRYCDGVIKKWHESNIKTLDAIKQSEDLFRSTKKTTKKVSKTSTNTSKAPNNRFANFPQRKWDFDKIEQIGNNEL